MKNRLKAVLAAGTFVVAGAAQAQVSDDVIKVGVLNDQSSIYADADAVMAKMREIKVNDFFAKGGVIREDGRHVHDMYLFQVKKPEESKAPWDYYKLVATVKGEDAFIPPAKSECPLLKKG